MTSSSFVFREKPATENAELEIDRIHDIVEALPGLFVDNDGEERVQMLDLTRSKHAVH